VIVSVVYLLVRCLFGCLMVLPGARGVAKSVIAYAHGSRLI
jgi:hypothetical protein